MRVINHLNFRHKHIRGGPQNNQTAGRKEKTDNTLTETEKYNMLSDIITNRPADNTHNYAAAPETKSPAEVAPLSSEERASGIQSGGRGGRGA